jgi:DNA modification methylase
VKHVEWEFDRLVLQHDCIEAMDLVLPDESVHCCVTSPPYFGLRDYGVEGQIGRESTPDEFVAALVVVFREVHRVLRNDGTLWLNLGDSYGAGKQLLGIPWRVAFALQEDGWLLRQEIIWHKTNAMPESAKDRCTRAHEQVFLLTKSPRYHYDAKAIEEPAKWERWGNQTEIKTHQGTAKHLGGKTIGELPIRDKKNKRSVWSVPTGGGFKGSHCAVFPPDLIKPCILAGCPVGGIVLDPFGGSGTTAGVALAHNRKSILCELNPEYAAMIPARIESIRKRHENLSNTPN